MDFPCQFKLQVEGGLLLKYCTDVTWGEKC